MSASPDTVEKVVREALPQFGVALKGEDVAKIKTVGDAVDLVVSRSA